MFECIFLTVQTYTVVKFRLGGLFMDYKKEIIEMIQKIHNESMIKFIYGCVKRVYSEERAGR